jgi:hypothetical protein
MDASQQLLPQFVVQGLKHGSGGFRCFSFKDKFVCHKAVARF